MVRLFIQAFLHLFLNNSLPLPPSPLYRYDQALTKIKEARKLEGKERVYVLLLSTKECAALALAGRSQEAIEVWGKMT